MLLLLHWPKSFNLLMGWLGFGFGFMWPRFHRADVCATGTRIPPYNNNFIRHWKKELCWKNRPLQFDVSIDSMAIENRAVPLDSSSVHVAFLQDVRHRWKWANGNHKTKHKNAKIVAVFCYIRVDSTIQFITIQFNRVTAGKWHRHFSIFSFQFSKIPK